MEAKHSVLKDKCDRICGESLLCVGTLQIATFIPHDMCELFLTCVNDKTSLYHGIRRDFGDEMQDISNWTDSDFGTLSRHVRYKIHKHTQFSGVSLTSLAVNETQHVTLGEMVDGEWQSLILTIISEVQPAEGGSGGNGSVHGRLCWQIVFTISDGAVNCALFCGADASQLSDLLCKFDTLHQALLDEFSAVANNDTRWNGMDPESDDFASTAWLKLVTISTSERSNIAQGVAVQNASNDASRSEKDVVRDACRHSDPTTYAAAESNLEANFRVMLSEAASNSSITTPTQSSRKMLSDDEIDVATAESGSNQEDEQSSPASGLSPAISKITAGGSVTPAPKRFIKSQEYGYFSTRLGINFRLHSGNVLVGSVDNGVSTSNGCGAIFDEHQTKVTISDIVTTDDVETCTLLSTADLRVIRERSGVEDTDYCASLDIIGYNRSQAVRQDQQDWYDVNGTSSINISISMSDDSKPAAVDSNIRDPGNGMNGKTGASGQEEGTFADRFNREKLWAYGPDSVKPTYYINAAPQRVSASTPTTTAGNVPTPLAHRQSNSSGSGVQFYSPVRTTNTAIGSHTTAGTTSTTTAHAVPVANHGSSLGDDPRSPSARTPIAPVAVVDAVLLGPVPEENPFDGLETDDYLSELAAAAQRAKIKPLPCHGSSDIEFATTVAALPPPPPVPPMSSCAGTNQAGQSGSGVGSGIGMNLGGVLDMECENDSDSRPIPAATLQTAPSADNDAIGTSDVTRSSEGGHTRSQLQMKRESCKILVLCPAVFGESKKIWKVDLPCPAVTSEEAEVAGLSDVYDQQLQQSLDYLTCKLAGKYDLPYPFWEGGEMNAYFTSSAASDTAPATAHGSRVGSGSGSDGSVCESMENVYRYVILDAKMHRNHSAGDDIAVAVLPSANAISAANGADDSTFEHMSSIHNASAAGMGSGKITEIKSMQLINTSYFDSDVDETVSLDSDALVDFLAQKKKVLNVHYDRTVRVACVVMHTGPHQSESTPPQINEAQEGAHSQDGLTSLNSVDCKEKTGDDESDAVAQHTPSASGIDDTAAFADVLVHSHLQTPQPQRHNFSASPYGGNNMSRQASWGLWHWLPPRSGGPAIGSKLTTVNGVRIRGLDRYMILMILKQRIRPLVLEFDSISNDDDDHTSTGDRDEYGLANASMAPVTVASSTISSSGGDDVTVVPGAGSFLHPAPVTGIGDDQRSVGYASTRQSSSDSTPGGGGRNSSGSSRWNQRESTQISTSIYAPSPLRTPSQSRILSDDSNGSRDQSRIPESTFLAKYSHPVAKPLRLQVEKVLKSYITCDWSDTKSTGGSPQVFVTSLYRSIESELENLGLFDSTKPQGGGIPVMQESHWTDVRSHIENLVFNSIYDTTWALAPPPGGYAISSAMLPRPHGDMTDDDDGGENRVARKDKPGNKTVSLRWPMEPLQRELMPLHFKFAYLGFLTLQHLGLDIPSHLAVPSVYFPFLHDVHKGHNKHSAVLPEEWKLALKELSIACEMKSPLKIMQKLKSAIAMGAHALEGMLSHAQYYSRPDTADINDCDFDGDYSGVSHPHVGFAHAACSVDDCSSAGHSSEPTGMSRLRHLLNDQSGTCGDSGGRGEESSSKIDPFATSKEGDGDGLHAARYRVHRRAVYRNNVYDAGSDVVLGADELMPLLSWMIIQANPPNIDRAIWLCAEFRHHTLQMGEYAYALTQVSSALEFCKELSWQCIVISEEEYAAGIQRYDITQNLIQASKQGDSALVRELLEKGADVNGLTPEQSDNPLSIAIKHRHTHILHILLSSPKIDVNSRISPYHTPSMVTPPSRDHIASPRDGSMMSGRDFSIRRMKDYTPLMLAAFSGSMDIVSLLLEKGADRTLTSGSGDTAATLAFQTGHYDIIRVLIADPVRLDLAQCLFERDIYLLRGLLLQSTVDVNRMLCVDIATACAGTAAVSNVIPARNVYYGGSGFGSYSVTASALMVAVYLQDISLVNILLNTPRVHVNIRNGCMETALMWCALISPTSFDASTVSSASGTARCGDNRVGPQVVSDNHTQDGRRMDMALSLLRAGADRYAIDQFGQTAYVWSLCGGVSGQILPFPDRRRSAEGGVGNSGTSRSVYMEEDMPGNLSSVHTEAVHTQQCDTTLLNSQPYNPSIAYFPRLAAVLYFNPDIFHIWDLAREGNIDGVRALLEQGVSINAACPRLHYTPLIAAVHNSDIKMVDFLLQNATIDVNKCGANKMTPLHYAAQSGNVIIVGMLLRFGADRSALNDNQLAALDFAGSKRYDDVCDCIRFDPKKVSVCLAAKHGDMKVFKALIQQGVSVNAKLRHVSSKGCHHELTTPLIAAVYYDQVEFIQALVVLAPPSVFAKRLTRTYATVTSAATSLAPAGGASESALHGAVPTYRPNSSTAPADTGPGTTAGGNCGRNRGSVFFAPIGRDYIMRYALTAGEEGLDINCTNMLGQTPLMYAASQGNESLVLFLLKQQADRNRRDGNGDKACDWAKRNNHQSIYMILICDPQVSTVHAAIREGNVEATVAFFKQNPNPNQRWYLNQSVSAVVAGSGRGGNAASGTVVTMPTMAIEGVLDGEPPLVVAAKFNRVPIINILLRAPGIDVDTVDTFGKTPLTHAAENGHEETVLLLLKHKANRYAMDYSQQTALDYAERGGYAAVIAVLRADPYKVYVHDVCEAGEVGLVNGLLKQGCPVNFRDERTGKHSRTPLMCAAAKGQFKVVEFLVRAPGVDLNAQDADGITALMHAARIGELEITGLLLSCGADRNQVDKKGRTADNHASAHGYMTMLQFKGQQMMR